MNLLMIAPLLDTKGTIRYYIGAQVDVSGLLKDCTDLEALARLVERSENPDLAEEQDLESRKDDFQGLSEMFNVVELATVRKHGGRMHRDQIDEDNDRDSIASHRPRLLIQDPTSETVVRSPRSSHSEDMSSISATHLNGRLQGVYKNVSQTWVHTPGDYC